MYHIDIQNSCGLKAIYHTSINFRHISFEKAQNSHQMNEHPPYLIKTMFFGLLKEAFGAGVGSIEILNKGIHELYVAQKGSQKSLF